MVEMICGKVTFNLKWKRERVTDGESGDVQDGEIVKHWDED